MKIVPALAASSIVLAGCAQTPHATISYRLARTDAAVTVARTIKCDKDNVPHVVDLPSVAVTFGADPKALGTLDTSRLDGPLADTSLDLQFTPDQRLKSVNAESTGQGEAILTAAVKLAASVFLPGSGAETAVDVPGIPPDADVTAQCIQLTKEFGTEAMTVTYAGALDLGTSEIASGGRSDPRLSPLPQDVDRSRRYAALLGSVCARIQAEEAPVAPVSRVASPGGYATLTARQPRSVTLRVAVSRSTEMCPIENRPGFIWAGTVAVGQLGTTYAIPIPRAALFGKQSFELAVDESGALTQVKYGKSTGAGQAVSVASAGVAAVRPSTDAERTAAIEAEIALRKAQEHRAKCLADPAAC